MTPVEKIKKFMGSFPFKENLRKASIAAKNIIVYLVDLLGFRYIFLKLHPPIDPATNKRKPITLTLWILGIYVAAYGLASQRYENRIDIIENRASAIFTQLTTPSYKQALSKIPTIQNMRCPKKPDFLVPYTAFESLFSVYDIFPHPEEWLNQKDDKQAEAFWDFRKNTFGIEGNYHEIVELFKSTIEDWKDSLEGLDLEYAILDHVNLESADLSSVRMNDASITNANLKNVNFENAHLWQSDFSGSVLEDSNLEKAELVNAKLINTRMANANLRSAVFDDADCENSDFTGANFENASIRNVNFEGANLLNTKALTINQLITVFTLKNAQIPSHLLSQIETRYSFLFADREKRNDLKDYNLEKLDLSYSSFRNANLSNANLKDSDLFQANLSSANLKGADLSGAQLYNASLGNAILNTAKLRNANMSEANCWSADFSDADFKDTILKGAMLRQAILYPVKNLTVQQICLAETIYEAKIDELLVRKIEKACPAVFERPSYQMK